MRLPQYPKREKIGNPELFYGREKEIDFFLQWASEIPEEKSKSRALMATKKMGKTAILERLYNILFVKKGPVIPFYFRVPEENMWKPEFAQKFFFTFLTQYLAFTLNRGEWCSEILSKEELKNIAQKSGLKKIEFELANFEGWQKDSPGNLWNYAAGTPHRMSAGTGDFFLQLIDEFQFLNRYIFIDQELKIQTDLAGVYLEFAESKTAPLLVTGSYFGWLRGILNKLTSRFRMRKLDPFTPGESLRAIYNYANHFNVALGEESAPAIRELSHNHPYYLSTLIRSDYPSKDLTTPEGIDAVYRYEAEEEGGEIYNHWQEYIDYAFEQTNGKLAKAIILYLSQNSEQEKTRAEILDHLTKQKGITTVEDGKELDDTQLEKRLILLERSDVIAKGSTAFRYKGISDVVFNQVFQIMFSEEIDNVKKQETIEAIRQKNKEAEEKGRAKAYQDNKGPLLEHMMIQYLRYQTKKRGIPSLRELVGNLPESVSFVNYQNVGGYHFNLPDGYHRQFDVLAKAAQEGEPSLVIECKNWEKPVGPQPIEEFAQKAQELKKHITPLIPIFYSVSGYTAPALKRLKELNLAWSSSEQWPLLKGT